MLIKIKTPVRVNYCNSDTYRKLHYRVSDMPECGGNCLKNGAFQTHILHAIAGDSSPSAEISLHTSMSDAETSRDVRTKAKDRSRSVAICNYQGRGKYVQSTVRSTSLTPLPSMLPYINPKAGRNITTDTRDRCQALSGVS